MYSCHRPKKNIIKQMEAFIQSCIYEIPSKIQKDFDEWKCGARIRPFQAPTAFEFSSTSWFGISEDDKQSIFEK